MLCFCPSSSVGVPTLLRSVVREDGFRALYRGATPSLIGIIPYAGIAFSINEQAKHEVSGWRGCFAALARTDLLRHRELARHYFLNAFSGRGGSFSTAELLEAIQTL